ncbi:MAG: hypothetical protein EXR98_10340 [Gemmataceae bacterium]|nr:hypothetical protein [Gemmataceae bacterium]
MNTLSDKPVVLDPLRRLTQRVRWKRWSRKLHRLVWLLTLTFLAIFVADMLFGLRTLSLRIAFSAAAGMAVALFVADWITAWLVRLDTLGLANLLEKRYPELAERLLTLVQMQTEESASSFAPLFRAETEQHLATIDPAEACPLRAERVQCIRTGAILAAVFGALSFAPAFGFFAVRFFAAWATPLVPLEIELIHGNGYALRGGSYSIEAKLRILDQNAVLPESCELACEDEAGGVVKVVMKAMAADRFSVVLEDLKKPLRCGVRAGEAGSEPFEIRLIDAPVLAKNSAVSVSPPNYLVKDGPRFLALGEAAEDLEILQYSTLMPQLSLDRSPVRVRLRMKKTNGPEGAEMFYWPRPAIAVLGAHQHLFQVGATEVGEFQADLVLDLEHGLTVTLPVGNWTVYADSPPRFTQPLRLHGGTALAPGREYRIAPDDLVKLQTEVEDREGLGTVSIEWRVNDKVRPLQKWLDAGGKKTLAINDWLPLPTGLKEGDRLAFRIHVSDNRLVRQGEASYVDGPVQGQIAKVKEAPAIDQLPQITIAPAASGDGEWFTLRVDRSLESFLKEQTQAQNDEVREVIALIRKKLQNEQAEVEQLQRATHQSTALTLMHLQQTEKLQGLNREIVVDLATAAGRFNATLELATLAEKLIDIAEVEMRKSADALECIRGKDRTVSEAEKELQITKDAVLAAIKKLDGALEWNKLRAQDRLDQLQLEKLAKRQDELANRLQKLLEEPPLSDEDKAKQIEAIRQEQQKIAEQTAKLQEESKLVQESMAALEKKRVAELAQQAKELAMEQRAGSETSPDQMPAEIKERLAKLAKLQEDLARRVTPFAKDNQGPDVKPAQAAADALKKLLIDPAIEQQKEHEKRLADWLGKLLPGVDVKALREQILELAKKQKAVRTDFEKFAAAYGGLNETMKEDGWRGLVKRQKELSGAIAKLPIPDKDARLRPAQQGAEVASQQAHDRLAKEDSLPAHKAMEQAQRELEALAALLPAELPTERTDVKDPVTRAKIDQIDVFAREQGKLRAEMERVRADLTKALAGGGDSLKKKMDKLAADLLELAQKGGPEAKGMAKESAKNLDEAKKAMEASQAMKAKGEADDAKKMDEEAAKKLDLAVKQLAKLSQDSSMSKDDDGKTAEALNKSAKEMKKAAESLPSMPKNAQTAMKSAAESLAQAAKQADPRAKGKTPSSARNPAAKSTLPLGKGDASLLPKDVALEMLKGKAWGELPGELKTKMLQDYRARFGEDYAEMIRQYFERLNETPGRKE